MKIPAPSNRWPSDGLPVSSRSADSNGRVIRYTFADGTQYLEPVEPLSEQYINSAAVTVPGGIALSRGKGLTGAARAIAAEAIDDAATSRASQAANAATGGYLRWIPAPIASILFGGKPEPRVWGVVDDAAEAAKDAGTEVPKGADDTIPPATGSTISPGLGTPLSDHIGSTQFQSLVRNIDTVDGNDLAENLWPANNRKGYIIAHGTTADAVRKLRREISMMRITHLSSSSRERSIQHWSCDHADPGRTVATRAVVKDAQ